MPTYGHYVGWARGGWRLVTIAILGVAAPLFWSPATAQGQPAPVTIALITSLTGPSAPETASSPAGFLARIDQQNAEGGVNGHKIVPLVIDDQTSPTQIVTAVQDAISKGAIGIVSASALFFLAAKYPQAARVPVTGSYSDGPEWGEQPYTNMFASDLGSLNPKLPVNTLEGKILHMTGGTVLGAYGYGISPSSSREAYATTKSFEHFGGKSGVLDTSLPFGTVDFSSLALSAKQQHINALFPTMIDASNFALATSLKQAGVDMKAAVFATGYGPAVVHSSSWPYLIGDYFLSIYRPFSLPDAGTRQMAQALEHYEHFTKTQFPTLFQYEAWAGADLMIKGLRDAGSDPTRAGVITALRHVRSYDAGGLLPNPLDYATIFGHDPAQQCVWILKAEQSGFVPVSTSPTCGTDLPGTSTAGVGG